MSHEEIIAMAREADPFGDDGRLVSLAMLTPGTLERFAALAAAKEREACAIMCEVHAAAVINDGKQPAWAIAHECAARGLPNHQHCTTHVMWCWSKQRIEP